MKMHKNAKLTPLGRERMVKMMLDGHTCAKAAAVAGVSPGTARKWLVRSPAWMHAYRDVGGRAASGTSRRGGRAASGTGRRTRPKGGRGCKTVPQGRRGCASPLRPGPSSGLSPCGVNG